MQSGTEKSQSDSQNKKVTQAADSPMNKQPQTPSSKRKIDIQTHSRRNEQVQTSKTSKKKYTTNQQANTFTNFRIK